MMSTNIPFANPSAVPHAPPLPAQRPLQRARDAANKFFGYQPSRPPSPREPSGSEGVSRDGVRRYAALGAGNATASHRTGLEINTIAVNEKGTHALLGGKEIFKTIRVEEGSCAEELNLRSAIRSNPKQASGKTRQIYSIDIADVAWARGDSGDFVAAATSSGKIILYDLGHAGLQAAQLHEHFRHVHKVTFNPHRGNLLLSGSQDGTVRLWDMRDVRQASTLHSKRKYSGLGDGVRDVKWSPTEGVEFALGTDSGWVQCWDMRNLKTPKIKLPAHSTTCNAVDWHPDGKHLVSASSDKTVRVWDFSGARRQKCDWEIRTPYSVFNARWRPSCESSLNRDPLARQCTQLVTTYDQEHPIMHIWDFRRPSLPFREMSPYPTSPTDMIWHSQDLLWTVGREGVFLQADIQHAPKVIEKRTLQSLALSSRGEMNSFIQKRNHNLPSKRNGLPESSITPFPEISQHSKSSSFERSWRDDGLDRLFLSIANNHSVTATNHKARAASMSAGFPNEQQITTITLDQILRNRKSFRPFQSAFRGALPLAGDLQLFRYFSRKYKFDANEFFDATDFVAGFESILSQNAAVARNACLYRLAQMWEIVETAMARHLKERAEYRRKGLQSKKTRSYPQRSLALGTLAKRLLRENLKSPSQTPSSLKPSSGLMQPVIAAEISSNAPTPQARPQQNGRNGVAIQTCLPDPDKEHLTLPPLLSSNGHKHLSSDGRPSIPDRKLTVSNLTGFQQSQALLNRSEKADIVRRWSVQPKDPLDLAPQIPDGQPEYPPRLEKHDSNESFSFLDASTDSRGDSFPSSLESAKSGEPQRMVSERPSRMETTTVVPLPEGITPDDFGSKRSSAVPIPGSLIQSGPKPLIGEAVAGPKLSSQDQTVLRMTRTEEALGYDLYPDENGIVYDFDLPAKPVKRALRDNSNADTKKIQRTWGQGENDTQRLPLQSVGAEDRTNPNLVYLPQDDDDDLEMDKPFTTVDLINELISHYASNGDVQTAASLVMLSSKFLPRSKPLSDADIAALVPIYAEGFATAGLTPEDATSVFDGSLSHVVRTGLQPLQIESILSCYHDQLVAVGLLCEAVLLRKLAYPTYPSVYDDSIEENDISIKCSACGEPMPLGEPSQYCRKCDADTGTCPVCSCIQSPFEQAPEDVANCSRTSLLTACLICGHSGHTACLQLWFNDSDLNDGGCPTSGCLCDCTEGRRRTERLEAAERDRRSNNHTSITSDDWTASQSRAVERTRSILGRNMEKGNRAGGVSA